MSLTTRPESIRKRRDFLAANAGKRYVTPAFVLLVHPRGDETEAAPRYGITVTKKIGNAVVRNRIKRRFRELLWRALPDGGIAGADHVLIARKGAEGRGFHAMIEELDKGLAHLKRKLTP